MVRERKLTMANWVRIGSRIINLENVTEVRFHDRSRIARVYYVGGGAVELEDDEADELRVLREGVATEPEPEHRTISTPLAGS
jgi:hypothetical protein